MATKSDRLAVETRQKTGSTAATALRKVGKIPGVLYGHGVEAKAVALDGKAFAALLHARGRHHLLEITIDGKTHDTAMLREVQLDPLTRRPIHADLQRVSATETVAASLPIVTVGTADGVRNSGGVMDIVLHAIDVEGPANALPERIEIDVTELGINQHVTAGDVKLPENLKLDMDPAAILIAIEPSRTEREALEAEVAAPEPVAAEVPTVAESTPEESAQ